MYKGFNLRLESGEDCFEQRVQKYECERYKKRYKDWWNTQEKTYEKWLYEVVDTKDINGSSLQEEWFPEVEADIFISHSHKDKDCALALAGWLDENFGLKCFIDANIWGYAEELKDKLNDQYSEKCKYEAGYLYNYRSCNQVSSHVDNMLMMALQNMIDKTETTFLLNTDSSVTIDEGTKISKTYSPWIYSEMMCTKIVRKKPLLEYRKCSEMVLKHFEEGADRTLNKQLPIYYELSLSQLTSLNKKDLRNWHVNWKNRGKELECSSPLDFLYRSKCSDEWKKEISYIQQLMLQKGPDIWKKYGSENKEKNELFLG